MSKYSKPFEGNRPMTSSYGPRTLDGKAHFHTGIDYGMPINTPIFCVDGGTVTFSGQDQFGGKYVDIKADSDGGITRLLHLNEIWVKKGDKVKTGQQIGLSGNTGWSTGPHLHLEFVNAVNPSLAGINPNTGEFDMNIWAEPSSFNQSEQENMLNTITISQEEYQKRIAENDTFTALKKEYEAKGLDIFTAHNEVSNLQNQLKSKENEIWDLIDEKESLQDEINNAAKTDTMVNVSPQKETIPFTYPDLSDEKWSWNKFFVGLSKNAYLTGLLGVGITAGTAWVCNQVPELQPFQDQIVLGLLSLTGLSVTGQNLTQIVKNN